MPLRDYLFGTLALLICAGLGVELAWYGIPDAAAQQATVCCGYNAALGMAGNCWPADSNNVCRTRVTVPARKPPVPAPGKCHVEISRAKNGKMVAVWDASCDLNAFEQSVALEWGKVKP